MGREGGGEELMFCDPCSDRARVGGDCKRAERRVASRGKRYRHRSTLHGLHFCRKKSRKKSTKKNSRGSVAGAMRSMPEASCVCVCARAVAVAIKACRRRAGDEEIQGKAQGPVRPL